MLPALVFTITTDFPMLLGLYLGGKATSERRGCFYGAERLER
jgi:hypothetical protein